MARDAVLLVEAIVACCFAISFAGYSLLLARACQFARRGAHDARRRAYTMQTLVSSGWQPVVTVVVPAHQEADSIVASVRSMLRQQWQQLEVIVVPNGCTDATLANLREAFALRETIETPVRPPQARGTIRSTWRSSVDPRLRVLETSGGGKADAANCGIERAVGEFVLLVDADSLLAPHAIARAMLPFVERGDRVAAVSAGIRVLNGSSVRTDGTVTTRLPSSWLARMQCVEYARAFQIGRAGWAAMDALPVVSGAFGLFRTSLLRAVGGLDTATVGEDLEIVLRLQARVRHHGSRPEVVFLPEPLCWTEVPEDIASLRGQRIRWHRGLVEAVQRHGDMLLDRRHGAVGMLSFPFLGLFELAAPLIELVGLAALAVAAAAGAVSWLTFVALFGFAFCFGTALSMAAVLLEQVAGPGYLARRRDAFVLLGASMLEQLGYRQRTAVWRLQGLTAGLARSRASWGEMHHRGARRVAGDAPAATR